MSRTRAASAPRHSEHASENVAPRGSSEIIGPIVKWAGGKSRLLPELLSRLPSQFARYYEPFAGGLALFFALRPEGAVLGDANADLVATYREVASDVYRVIDWLTGHAAAHSSEHYYEVRQRWNDGFGSPSQRAAAFLYLNRVCFNGLYRVNRAGEFNVPFGAYRNPRICDAEKLRAAARVLAAATLLNGDYRTTTADASRGDLVYFDPPYDETFNAYTAEAFCQESLAVWARVLVRRGCHVVVSNSDTPRVRALYAGFGVETVRCPRAINSRGTGRGEVDELVIVGRPQRAAVQLDMFATGVSP